MLKIVLISLFALNILNALENAKVIIPKGIYRCVFNKKLNSDWKVEKKLDSPAIDVLIVREDKSNVQVDENFYEKSKTSKYLAHYYDKNNAIVMHIQNKKVKKGDSLGVALENVISGVRLAGGCVYLGEY